MAAAWLHEDAERCLVSVAHGLANDIASMLRHRLLDVQQQAIDRLSAEAAARREAAHRRALREQRVAASSQERDSQEAVAWTPSPSAEARFADR
jgi:hypothetical protein